MSALQIRKQIVPLHYQKATSLSLRPILEPKQTAPNITWVIVLQKVPSGLLKKKCNPPKIQVLTS